jgi:hypothetical protein
MACWSCWIDGGSLPAGRLKEPIEMLPMERISFAHPGKECARDSAAADCHPKPGCWEGIVGPTLGYNIAVDIEASSEKAKQNPGCRKTGYRKKRGSSKEPPKTEIQTFAGRKSKRLEKRRQVRKVRKTAERAVQMGGTGKVIVDGLRNSSSRNRIQVGTGRLV